MTRTGFRFSFSATLLLALGAVIAAPGAASAQVQPQVLAELFSNTNCGNCPTQDEAFETFMKANTDVLVVDVTRNEGGYACYADELERRLIPKTFSTVGAEIRPSLDLIRDWESILQDAIDFGEPWEARMYAALVKDIKTAYSENRGRTGPIPFCSPGLNLEPATDRTGAKVAYDKPILVLTDEFSTSAADSFAAVMHEVHGKHFISSHNIQKFRMVA